MGNKETHNYCRNYSGHDHIYCYYGKGENDWEACSIRSIKDMKTKCALVEPFVVAEFHIKLSIMKKMRVKRCVSERQCNHKDTGSSFSVSCDDDMEHRLYAPIESEPFVDQGVPEMADVFGVYIPPTKVSDKFKPFYNIARSDP